MAYGIRAIYTAMQSETAANIAAGGGSYVLVATLTEPLRAPIYQNHTDVTITLAIGDSSKDSLELLTNQSFVHDIATNQQGTRGAWLPEGTKIYAKGAPTTGTVNICGSYCLGD